MSGVRREVRRTIGLGLLLQSILLLGPSTVFADPKPQLARSAQKRITASRARTGTIPGRPARCVHVVKRGDSLARLAALYGTTRQALITANFLTISERLRIGQRLRISECSGAPAYHHDEPEVTSINGTATELLARVGPRRILTRLFLAVPDFDRKVTAFQWPIEGAVASGFGRRHTGWHAGIDIQADMGAPIRAAAGGTVIESGWERYYGRVIKIQHNGGFTSIYAHNLGNLVDVGDEVQVGTVIATVGRTGHASANHLHFEIRQEGAAYNPLHLLEPRDTTVMASAREGTASAILADDEDRE